MDMNRNAILSTILACGLVAPCAAWADVYKYRDARGHILLTDKPMRGMKLLKRYSMSTGRATRASDSLAAMRKRQIGRAHV